MTAFPNPNVADRHSDVIVPGAGNSDGTLIGLSSEAKVGFYGTQPVAQPSISAGSGTLAELLTALGDLGLINLTA